VGKSDWSVSTPTRTAASCGEVGDHPREAEEAGQSENDEAAEPATSITPAAATWRIGSVPPALVTRGWF
jgi:hypothetical protein